ncbi:hypothetical protein [Gordonia hydrophobica]|uniref:Uncharacterized protein n=1 Tax=Gordonia hydrophobica TaxID=40516 RepID=A0ABZ2U713_9ACTN|nr:hypothetical protein [Gordonia hydrophobica]MBM7365361.1 hypothetical protein [Gordonia hydrophobica]
MTTAARRAIACLTTIAAVAALMFGTSPHAAAQPGDLLPKPQRVDQLGDFVYAQLFTVGVQVYERVAVKESIVYAPKPTKLYTPVLERLHSPTDGHRGTLRYGFIGSRLPEAFSTQGTLYKPSTLLGSGHISALDPKTHEPRGFSELCVNDPTNGRPIGPLAGGSLALWCPS